MDASQGIKYRDPFSGYPNALRLSDKDRPEGIRDPSGSFFTAKTIKCRTVPKI